jgi:hypothetical protein
MDKDALRQERLSVAMKRAQEAVIREVDKEEWIDVFREELDAIRTASGNHKEGLGQETFPYSLDSWDLDFFQKTITFTSGIIRFAVKDDHDFPSDIPYEKATELVEKYFLTPELKVKLTEAGTRVNYRFGGGTANIFHYLPALQGKHLALNIRG